LRAQKTFDKTILYGHAIMQRL